MDVIPLAFDSMGVRSMCCLLQGEITILIDPGASLAPHRYGLPPHKRELEQLMKKRDTIQECSRTADIITVSHWHNDHHTPFINGLYGSVTPEVATSLYQDKKVLGKGLKGLNFMQKKRAVSFLKHVHVDFCDGKTYSFGDVELRFSSPVQHGTFKKIPVIMVCVEEDNRIVHASDTQGFSGLTFIKEESPDLLIMSGPPVHLLSPAEIKRAESTILDMMDCCSQLILDHHHVRCLQFKEALPDIWKNPKVKTAAEYTNQPNSLLEARRKELFTGPRQSSF